jgi:ORF 12 gene product N-terminal
MRAVTNHPARARRRLRSGALLGLVCIFLAPMATLAVAGTGDEPGSAIPQKTLDRLLGSTAASSGAKSGSAQVVIPSTPAGAQLAWLLAEVNGGSATLTAREVRGHVSAHFLSVLPAGSVVRLLKQATNIYGPLRLTGYSGLSSARLAMAFVTTKAQRKLVIHVGVDHGAGHRITDLDISDRG